MAGWAQMGNKVCSFCGLSVHVSWGSRHSDAGCDARVGLARGSQFNAARILLGDYIRATGSHSRKELAEHLLANFPPGVSWEATPHIVEQVVDGYMKFWHLENEENRNMEEHKAETAEEAKKWAEENLTEPIVIPDVAPDKFLELQRKLDEGIFAEGSLYPMLRVGPYRIATVGAQCWVLEDGADVSEQIKFSYHTAPDSLQAAVDYCIARSVHHRSRDNYAVARWSVDDVHSYREDNELPEWTDDQASDFLAGAEGNIQDRMIESGWEALETLIRMAEEDEDIDIEA